MNPETVLDRVSTYAPAEHVEQLRQTLSQAEHAFHNSLLPHDVTITRPANVAHILAEWQVPVPFIEIAVWSAALPVINREGLLSHLDEEQARIASHLVSFMGLLTEYRRRPVKCEIKLPVLSNFWDEGFFVLVVAMFLDALRYSAHSHKRHDKKEMALQARIIFDAIVSQHLGLHSVQKELRDLVFQCEDGQRYAEVKQRIDNQRHMLRLTIETIEAMVRSKAEEYGIYELKLQHQIARPYMLKSPKYKGRLDACDLVSFVAILPDEDTCYRFQRPLHMLGNAHPDPEGYHPLHHRIHIEPYGPLNFYIRTLESDKEYNSGVLNRWQNGEKRLFEKVTDLIPHKTSRIVVYSKHGDPHFLPYNATPVDLAYRTNEMTGHSYSKAYVFGKGLVERDYPMEDGDIVEIITGYRAEPDLTWLESVKTTEARKFIQQWEARQAVHNNDKRIAPKIPALSQEDKDITGAVIIPSEYEGTICHRCIHCRPYPPQHICAYVTHRGLTIHQVGCANIHDRMQTIPISWRASNVRSVSRVLTIEAWDHAGLLREIFENLADYNINIIRLDAKSRTDMTTHIVISLHEKNPEIVEKIRHTLHTMSAVQSVMVDQPQETAISAPYVTRTDAKIFNPYTLQPVANPGIFFGRRNEIHHIWRTLESGGHQNSILFWGQQHIGKTSLLRHFEARILEDPAPYYVPVYLSMQSWQHHQRINDLVLWFASQMHQSLAQLSTKHPFHFQLPKINYVHLRDNPEDALESYIYQLQQAITSQQLIVMVDEFQGIRQAPNNQGEVLISCLENLLENFRDISFIFAGSGRKSFIPHRLQNLASVIPLGVLEPQSAEDLIRLPVRPFIYEHRVVEKIKDLTHCHPYYIHLICSKIIDDAIDQPVTKRVLTEKDFNLAVDTLLSGNAGIFSQLLEATFHGDIVLDTLARSPASAGHYMEVRSLLHQLQEKLSQDRILDILDELTELEVLEQSQEDSNVYRIRLPLLQNWLQKNPHYR
ncbi:MAG TPA: TGS domain-containing protein [Ktedonobacteraceae bacterium]|nr:TGS domain-containing protein [Ktedonobacteraceae bacterium]